MDRPLLTLTNQSAQHPLRRMLPPPVTAPIEDDKDWKLFLTSFAAFFICFYTFLL